MPITISLVGYYSVTLSEHSTSIENKIYLSPKINELDEVLVTAKAGNRNRDLRIFKREFLGETENAGKCDILNENDLRFSFNSDSGLLRAFSLNPIIIHNRALGYTITYYLDKFEYEYKRDKNNALTETFIMLGNYLFEDDLLMLHESAIREVEERRKNAYLGSRMHFFRLLYQGNLQQTGANGILLSDNSAISEGFSISSVTTINANSLVIRKDSISKYLINEEKLYIKYQMKYSQLDINVVSVYFEKNGYFDPLEVTFAGYMSRQRIGDLLPFEYTLE